MHGPQNQVCGMLGAMAVLSHTDIYKNQMCGFIIDIDAGGTLELESLPKSSR